MGAILIQTVGRAARNLAGRAIMYANDVTGSMERALAEMARRRTRQVDYNVLHGITPHGVTKAVIRAHRSQLRGNRAEALQ